MRNKKITILPFLFAMLCFIFTSCEDWLDINTDPNSPSEAEMTESIYLPGILAQVAFELTGGFPARYPSYWMLQVGRDAPAPDFATYDIDESDVNNTWTYTVYTAALKNSVKMTDLAENNGNFHYAGLGKVISAYIVSITTDCWGDIPLTQAFQPETYPFPAFDSQESIYNAVFGMLDAAIADLNRPSEGQNARPGAEDYLFGGDIALWIKFAYTLKARYAMRLTYAPGKTGSAQADIVLASLANGLTSNDENPGVAFSAETGSEAPWNQWLVKWEAVNIWANEFMINMMNSKNDPRRSIYFAPTITGDYVGHRTGNILLVEKYDSTSYLSETITAADQSVYLITFEEAKALEAEAYLWKGQHDNAQVALREAINANMLRLGIDQSDIDAYVAGMGDLPADFEAAQKMIIEEKYVLNFLSTEVWNDYRRTGYPVLSAADIDNPTYNTIPLRFMYPADVKQNNSLNEPDVNWLSDPLWWDNK